MIAYSRRLGRISRAQFQAALDRVDLGRFVRAEPVPYGLFGQNVFLTSTRGEFVLRGAPHYPWQFPTEQFFVEQLHDRTLVPVPHPYVLEPSDDIFGWSFAVMPRLPGLPLADQAVTVQLPPEERLEIARAMARTLVEAHRLTWAHAGRYDLEADSVQPFESGYGAWVVARTREHLALARSHNEHTTGTDVCWAEGIIAGAEDALRQPCEPCAVLGDYGEHNALAERTAGGWRVSGVFDLMTAHFGDGDADLAMTVASYRKKDPALADEFVREYLRARPARAGFAERQQVYALDLMASMWEYWQRSQGHVPGDNAGALSFEQWAGPAVDYWAGFGS